jgi:hypothetical protein
VIQKLLRTGSIPEALAGVPVKGTFPDAVCACTISSISNHQDRFAWSNLSAYGSSRLSIPVARRRDWGAGVGNLSTLGLNPFSSWSRRRAEKAVVRLDMLQWERAFPNLGICANERLFLTCMEVSFGIATTEKRSGEDAPHISPHPLNICPRVNATLRKRQFVAALQGFTTSRIACRRRFRIRQ